MAWGMLKGAGDFYPDDPKTCEACGLVECVCEAAHEIACVLDGSLAVREGCDPRLYFWRRPSGKGLHENFKTAAEAVLWASLGGLDDATLMWAEPPDSPDPYVGDVFGDLEASDLDEDCRDLALEWAQAGLTAHDAALMVVASWRPFLRTQEAHKPPEQRPLTSLHAFLAGP